MSRHYFPYRVLEPSERVTLETNAALDFRATGVATSSLAPGTGVAIENVSVHNTPDATALLFSISLYNTTKEREKIRIFVYDRSDPQAMESRTRERIYSAEAEAVTAPDLTTMTKVYVTSGSERQCGACARGLYVDHVEAMTVVDGVPYYAHTESHSLNDLVDQLTRVLDDHGVPTKAFFLELGPMRGFGVA